METNEVAFWEAVSTEDYEGMITACGGDPSEVITKFVASDIAIATLSQFEKDDEGASSWTFADAQRIFANPSDYDEACLAMGSWAEYVEEQARCLLDD